MAVPYTKYATELWDGFDALSKHSEGEIVFCKDVVKFIKKRAKIEAEYAQKLEKLAESKCESKPLGTLDKAWQGLIFHSKMEAEIHNTFNRCINEKVLESLTYLIKDTENTRKSLVSEGTALNNELNEAMASVTKAKNNYEKASKEAEQIANATKQDPIAAKKAEKEIEKKQLLVTQTEDLYRRRVEVTNLFIDSYYNEKMPKILCEFEKLDTISIHMLKGNLKKFVLHTTDLIAPSDKAAKTMQESVDSISTDNNIDLVCRTYKTKGERIPHYEFEPFSMTKIDLVRFLSFKFELSFDIIHEASSWIGSQETRNSGWFGNL
eukprot:TRINITY_DN2715_c0_g1_i2.p1 TRINITY_DN2715_c0_g1~~TRINITY_DN2715_c0_g1_i2.p1  ORF type:complete len:322 (+),score=85.84 TRINITY_DN2715_c0_g1_i2:49-1014(+)